MCVGLQCDDKVMPFLERLLCTDLRKTKRSTMSEVQRTLTEFTLERCRSKRDKFVIEVVFTLMRRKKYLLYFGQSDGLSTISSLPHISLI
ncbi:hypothetical protein RRG08_023967 [Elysia crispata]|uniref:Uncharacterized protein n=1 Tax=Elysia crispata TaxID=231223 RepID=A0AAE0YMV4_9GAST|nr:hypothetical protein RRG08_023967 [Elysia crispata]